MDAAHDDGAFDREPFAIWETPVMPVEVRVSECRRCLTFSRIAIGCALSRGAPPAECSTDTASTFCFIGACCKRMWSWTLVKLNWVRKQKESGGVSGFSTRARALEVIFHFDVTVTVQLRREIWTRLKECLKAKDVVQWAARIHGKTFDGVGAIAAVNVPTSRGVMQATIFWQIRLPRGSGSRALVMLCWVLETSWQNWMSMFDWAASGQHEESNIMIVSQFLFEVLKPPLRENCWVMIVTHREHIASQRHGVFFLCVSGRRKGSDERWSLWPSWPSWPRTKQLFASYHSSPTMAVVDVNATVVVNMLTLEVVVQNIETAGESAGQTTAHEMLLARAGWKRNCCYGGAVQRGEFRAVSGYINGLREGYMAVTAPGYDGPHRAFGNLPRTNLPKIWTFSGSSRRTRVTGRRLTFQRKRVRRLWNWPQSL